MGDTCWRRLLPQWAFGWYGFEYTALRKVQRKFQFPFDRFDMLSVSRLGRFPTPTKNISMKNSHLERLRPAQQLHISEAPA